MSLHVSLMLYRATM